MTVNTKALQAALQGAIILNPTTGQYDFSTPFTRFLVDLVNDRRVNIGTLQPVEIASGVITIIDGFSSYSVTVETGSSDDIDTISNANGGDVIFLQAASDTATVVVKDGTGNILTEGSVDLSLDDLDDIAMCVFNETQSKWKCGIWNVG